MNIVFFGIYLAVLVIIFAFIAILIMHVKDFRQYSKYLSVVLKIYLIVVVILAIFWSYKILSNTETSLKSRIPLQKIEL